MSDHLPHRRTGPVGPIVMYLYVGDFRASLLVIACDPLDPWCKTRDISLITRAIHCVSTLDQHYMRLVRCPFDISKIGVGQYA